MPRRTLKSRAASPARPFRPSRWLIRCPVRRSTDPTTAAVEFVYEAGSCGYAIQRQLTGLGFVCRICAPSMTPRRPGERIKNDRRDSIALARLLRAGELTYVWVPDLLHEAIRDLERDHLKRKHNQH